jgi:hypothetical protein
MSTAYIGGTPYPFLDRVLIDGRWYPLDVLPSGSDPDPDPDPEPDPEPDPDPPSGQPNWIVENQTMILSGPGPHLIENRKWNGLRGNCIELRGASNVTIRNCWFSHTVSMTERQQIAYCFSVVGEEAENLFRTPIGSTFNGYPGYGGYAGDTRLAIKARNGSRNIRIENCYFEGVESAFQSEGCYGPFYFLNNEIKDVCGPFPRGQMVQLAWFAGLNEPVRIENNYMTSQYGVAFPEDNINIFSATGSAANPITIRRNYIRMTDCPETGTKLMSESGGGILVGDQNGTYSIIEENVIVNPGQYGLAINAGNNHTILNNKVYSQRTPVTNVGIYSWDMGGSGTYYNNRVEGNHVYWINKNNSPNPYWFAPNTAGLITVVNNTWQSNQVSASMPPPTACGIRTWSGPLTTS